MFPNFWTHLFEEKPPTVAMRFIYSRAPALVLLNESGTVARDMKWVVMLWNRNLPQRDEPLPIPISTFDWLKPHQPSGPLGLFLLPLAPLLRPGDRLFGTAGVNCPTCARGRAYIVSITWGKGGWYAEMPDETAGDPLVPGSFSQTNREVFFSIMEKRAQSLKKVTIVDKLSE